MGDSEALTHRTEGETVTSTRIDSYGMGFRCAKGVMCEDYRPGTGHAHGFAGLPLTLGRNHAAGCRGHGDLPNELGATCECGAATVVMAVPRDRA